MALTSDQEERLEEILHCADSPLLTPWERGFLADLVQRYEEEGEQVIVSSKMWGILLRIETKVQREETET